MTMRGERMSEKPFRVLLAIKDPRVALTTEGVTKPKEEARFMNFSISATDIGRFVEKVDSNFDINDENCWLWKQPLDNGYGRFWWNGHTYSAHRFSYYLFVGEIPNDKQLDHLCRNRGCVNPSHLEAVDIKTNVLRGIGLSAQNARKTHCKRNHPLTGPNLTVNNRGQRVCKECSRLASAKWYKRHAI